MANITVIIPNRTHAFPINVKGDVVSSENSGTDIFALVGTQKATPVDEITGPLQFTLSIAESNMFAGSITKDVANKKFVMSNVDGSSIGIVSDLPTIVELNSENAASFKNVPLVRGELQFTVNVSDQDGVVHTKTETCVYTKARSLFTTETIFIEVGTRLRASSESVLDPEGIKQISSFKWLRDGEEISGQTSNSYVVTNEDVSAEISAVLSYIDGKNNQKSVVAIANVFVVDSAPINFPIITGIPESGQTLTADTSFIFDRNGIATDFEYDWLIDDVSSGVTTSTYSLSSGELDVGKVFKVQVTYTDGAGIANSLVSPNVTIRDSAAGDSVVVFGTPSVGQTLQATLQTADGTTPTILSYEWRRNGRIIQGASSSTYKVKRADMNSFLSVSIEYDTGSGAVKFKTSGNINFQNSSVAGAPELNKVLEDGSETSDLSSGVSVGTLLKANVSNITDPDDIKDFYYSFDDLQDSDLLRDKVVYDTRISHNVVNVRRSSQNQNFFETSDEIVYAEPQTVQSIYFDNSLGNSGDVVYVQYFDTNTWKNALQISGKVSRMFLLDENIASNKWRLSLIVSSDDATLSSYTFDGNWSLESPSKLSTRKFIYQWQRNSSGMPEDIIGARKQTYLISQADLNSDVSVKVSYVDGSNKIVNLESNSASIQNYAPTGRVNVEGTAKVGFTLTAKPDLYDRDSITVDNPQGKITSFDSYQWYLDGVAIAGATSSTLVLTSAMQTKTVSVEVTYTDALNAQHTVRSRFNKKVNASPTGNVDIFGTPKVGKTLSINTSKLKDLNQFTQLFYQWFLVDGSTETQIENAALQSYVVKSGDVGKSLRANVYYTDNDGFQEVISTNTISILDSETTGKPSISGIPLAGGVVTANVANISDENGIASYGYQWRIDEVNVDGATFSSFTISADENGQYGNFLDLLVTVTDTAGNQKTLYSDPVRIALAAGTIGPDGGTIQGTNVSLTLQSSSLAQETVIYIYETTTGSNPDVPEGSTLVGTAWAFTPHGLTFEEPITIQFEVPQGTNLVLRADDENDNTFEIVENYSVSNTTATLQTNTFSVYVGSVFTPAVITGTPEQGNYLTASVSGDVSDVSFQWRRNGSNILAAQGTTYLVTSQDVGQMITVAATFTDANGVSATKISAETEILNTPAQGQIVVNGSRRVGVTLESQIISITDINSVDNSTYTYQWFRNSVAINGATSSTYEVVQDDFLKDLTVKVSFIDGAGKTETVQSEEVFISKKGSVFFTTNSRKQGDTLTVDTSTLNDFYALFNRQFTWYADNQAIGGSDSNKRQLTTFESGKNVKARFTYTDGRGTSEVLETEERFIHTISATITPAGGVFSNQGVTINVPAGAVSSNTDILVYVVPYDQAQLPIGTLTDQVGYAFTPLDLIFDQPITITLPKPNDEYDMVLYGTNNSVDEFIMSDEDFLTVDNANNKITIQTDTFGVFISAILYVRVDIIGTPEQGQVLDTLFTGEVFSKTYQWYRGEVPIAGETGTTYTVTLEDVGEEIRVVSTYLLEETSSPEIVESEPVLIVNSLPVVDTSVIISGEDRVGETLTANPSGISDANNPDGLSGFLYQWRTNGQEIAGATNNTLVLLPEHFHTDISVEITYVDATGLLETVLSDNFYITRIPPSGYVEVIGTPEVDEYLEVDTDNLVDLNGIGEFSYQWKADGVNLVGETNSTLLVTSAMENKAISVVLTYTDGVGEVETVTSQNALVIDADPTGAVTIDYTILEVAQTLTANISTIADANSPNGITAFAYQWYSNGAAIQGATNKSYVVANQFCNTDITVSATFVDARGYIETLTSEAVRIVNSPVQGRPTVSGNPDVGATLTINTTALSDVNVLGTFNYKWFADGVEIVGATSKTWVVAANSYVSKEITGQVYYVDGAGNNEQVNTSNGITILNSLPTGKPTISGVLQVGETLTVSPDNISDSNIIVEPFYYQWYANGVAVQDATGSTYVVQVSDINKNITVAASFYDEGNTYETVISNNYKIIDTPATGFVEIVYDSLQKGSVLTAGVNVQDVNEIISAFSYQWTRNGVNILNATQSTYTLGDNDGFEDVAVKVSFTDTGGVVSTFTSEPVNMINTPSTGEVLIDGDVKVGSILEANISNIEDVDTYPTNHFKSRPSYTLANVSGYGWSSSYRRLGVDIAQSNDLGQDVIYFTGYGTVSFEINFGSPRLINKANLYGFAGGYTIGRITVYYKDNSGNWTLAKDQSISYSFGSYKKDIVEFTNPVKATEWKVVIRNASTSSSWQGTNGFNLVGDFTGLNNKVPEQAFEYQWKRDGVVLDGETSKTYVTTFDDLYKSITVDVKFHDGNGVEQIPDNTAQKYMENSPPEGTVLIGGTRNVGESLFFTHNVVDRDNITAENPTGEVTLTSFQWYQSDSEEGALTALTEATGSTLLLTPELQAKWIALDVTYVDSEGDDDTIHASNRLPVKSSPTGNAVITSDGLEIGRQVFLDTSTIADLNDLGAFSYQWYRTEGTGSVAIEGAVQTHYSFQPADLGKNIFCIVSYVDGDGDAETVVSNQLGPIEQNLNSIGTISVTNTVEIGQTIESDVGNILVMNNFETVAPVVAYNFHSDTRDVSPNGLHLAGFNYAFDAEGGLDLSRSTSAYLRTSGTTPVLNNDTHTIAFRVMLKGGTSSAWRKLFSFGRSNTTDGSPEIWWQLNSKKLEIDYTPETSGIQTSDLEPDTWYDVMFVKQGSVCRVYVDGTLVNEYTGLPNPKSTGNYKLEFGGNSSYQAAPVIIKDFQIFDFAVDAYTSASNYPFYTEPTLSLQWKADGAPIAGQTGSVYQVPADNNQLGKDITLEVSLTDALGNSRVLESNSCIVVESDLQGDLSLLINGQTFEEILLNLGQEPYEISEYPSLFGKRYVGYFGDDVSWFNTAQLHGDTNNTTQINNFTSNSTYYSWMWYGYFYAPTEGTYTFYTTSDDASYVWIGETAKQTYNTSNAVVNNGGLHASQERSGQVYLTSGYHSLRIMFGQGAGGQVMTFAFAGPSISKTTNGSGYLYGSSRSWEGSHISDIRLYINNTISVNTSSVTDLNGIVAAEYQWYADNTALLEATGSSYIITQEEINKDIRVKVVFEDETGRKSARLSNEVSVANTPATGSVSITSTGELKVGNLLIANPSISDDNGYIGEDFFSYQWYRDGVSVSGKVRKTYEITNSDVGKNVSVKVSFVDNGNTIESITSHTVLILDSAGSGEVQILGETSVGSTLTADVSSISDPNGISSFSYVWKRDGVEIEGASNSVEDGLVMDGLVMRLASGYSNNNLLDYSLKGNNATLNQVDFANNVSILQGGSDYIRVTTNPSDFMSNSFTHMAWVYFTSDNGSYNMIFCAEGRFGGGSGTQLILAAVNPDSTSGNFATIIQNSVDGWSWKNTPSLGTVLLNTWRHVAWSFNNGTTKVYLDGNLIWADSSRGSYNGGTDSPFQIGARNDGAYSCYMNVASVECYNRELSSTEINKNISVTRHFLNSDGTAKVMNFGSPTYTLTADDYNKNISVDVEYVDDAGITSTPTNTASVYINKAPSTGAIAIEGTRKVLNTLTATNTIADQDGLGDFSYQWFLNGNPIAGENSSTLDIPYGYEGQKVSVSITYIDGNGDTEVVVSEQVEINNPVFGSVSITGTPKKGQVLVADTSNISDTNIVSGTLDNVGSRLRYTNETYYDFTKYTSTNSKPTDVWGAVNITEVADSVEFSSQNGATFTHGSSDSLRTPSVNILNNDYHTIALRIKFNTASNGSWYKIFTYGQTYGNDRSPGLWWHATGNGIHWKYNPNNTGVERVVLNVGQWYDVVGVKNGSTLKIYVDGVLVQTASVSNPKSAGNSNIIFGYEGWNAAAPMSIKQAVIVPQALTQEQVLEIFDFKNTNLLPLYYQWQREVSNGVFQNISGATFKSYTADNADVGKNIRCIVSYTDEQGFEEQVISQPILIENTQPTGQITFTGTLKTGNTIVASISNIADANGIASIPTYQWKVGGINVGSDSNSYTIVSDNVGKELSVTISFLDSNGVIESVTTLAGIVENTNPVNALKFSEQFSFIGEWSNEKKILASDRQSSDQFGSSVSISADGNTLAVGARYEDSSYTDQGAVYVYTRQLNGSWGNQRKILASDPQTSDHFGWSVSISADGNTLAVSAYAEDTSYSDQGAVYVYTRQQDGSWSNEKKILASDRQNYDYFGYSVSISADGNTLAVGAYLEDTSLTDQGAVYVYTRQLNGSWGNERKILASDPQGSDYFGSSVSISADGNTLAVGAYSEDTSYTDQGAVYVYTRQQDGSWGNERKILASDRQNYDHFGWSVSISADGNTLAVGARYEDTSPYSNQGAVYVYTRQLNGSWGNEKKILASDPQTSDYFGNSVSISADGNTLAVGAYLEDTSYSNQGAVYVYTRQLNGSWSNEKKILASDPQSVDYFGYSVSISADGNTLAVGAYGEDTSYADQGAVYTYDLGETIIDELLIPLYRVEGSEISLDTSLIADADGISELPEIYTWYRLENNEYIEISKNEKYIVDKADIGKTLKGQYQYIDNNGIIETLSLVFEVPSQNLNIQGLRVGDLATFSGLTNLDTIDPKDLVVFTWKVGGESVSNNEEYLIQPQDLGKKLELTIEIFRNDKVYRKFYGYATVGMETHDSLTYDYTNITQEIVDIGIFNSIEKNLQSVVYNSGRTYFEEEIKNYLPLLVNSKTITISLEKKILASDPQSGDYFGRSVSISADGNTLAVGAYTEDTSLTDQGAVYVYTRQQDGSWGNERKILASDPQGSDYFGRSVSISADGNTLAVGAIYEDTSYTDQGAVYVYTRQQDGSWGNERKILASDRQNYDYFGWSVSISADGNTLAVGAYLEDTSYSNQGAVYVYTRQQDGSWSNEKKILASDPQGGDQFGYSVSISADGNTLAVGAYAEGTSYSNQGAVYVYTRQLNGSWSNEKKILASDPQSYEYFGYSVSISADGNTLAVGAYGEDTSHTDQGAVYVYTRQQDGSWGNQQKILASDPQSYDYFGGAVSISADGNTLAVGAQYEDTSHTNQGAVYVYNYPSYYGGQYTRIYNELNKVNKVNVNLPENIVNELQWKWFVGEKLYSKFNSSFIDIDDEIRKFNKIRFEYSYSDYQGKTHKQSGMVHLVNTQQDTHEYTARQGSSFSLDLDTLFPSDTKLSIVGVEPLGGFPLPSWLSYNSSTKVISGTPGANDTNNLYLRVLTQEANDVASVDYGVVIKINVYPSTQSIITTHKQYDWVGVQNPSSIVSQYGLNSTRNWDGKFRLDSAPNATWQEQAIFEENFETSDWGSLGYLSKYDVGEIDGTYQQFKFIFDWSLNQDPSWQGKFQWHNRASSSFDNDSTEKLFEENFETSDWGSLGYLSKYDVGEIDGTYEQFKFIFDWSLNQDPSWEGKFQWHNRTSSSFNESYTEKLFEENFETSDWGSLGYLSKYYVGEIDGTYEQFKFIFDWSLNQDPPWEGKFQWHNRTSSSFDNDSTEKLFEENFEDETWSGPTRIEWPNKEYAYSIDNTHSIQGLWEGKFNWQDIPTPGFDEKTLRLEETFEEDWTI